MTAPDHGQNSDTTAHGEIRRLRRLRREGVVLITTLSALAVTGVVLASPSWVPRVTHYFVDPRQPLPLALAAAEDPPPNGGIVEFRYSCGCPGSFNVLNGDWVEMTYPKVAKEQYEKHPCMKCAAVMEYEQRKAAQRDTDAVSDDH